MGLPPGFPDPVQDLAWSRYLVAGLGVLWAVAQARASRFAVALAALAFVSAAVGFWVLALGRPYGLFVDADATRLAAETSVISTAGAAEGVLSAGPPARPASVLLGRSGLGLPTALLLPTFLPLLVLPVLALLVRLLWADAARAGLGALLWLAFSTGDLEAVRGAGVVTGLWARPDAAVALMAIVPAVLLLGRLPVAPRAGTLLAALPLAVWFLSPGPRLGIGLSEAALLLTVDQGLWLVLGAAGLFQRPDPSARALVIGGALGALASAAGAPADAWAFHACYRLGLILASTDPVLDLATRVGTWLSGWVHGLSRIGSAGRIGLAAALLLALPGSFLVWWDPTRLDPVARDSTEPLSSSVEASMEWIRRETPAGAVFVASAEYAPHVAVLGGRRLLRAPSLADAPDDPERLRAERLILSGRDGADLLGRYGVTHVFVAPGDFRARGVRRPEDLEANGRLRRRHADPNGLTVYEVVRP